MVWKWGGPSPPLFFLDFSWSSRFEWAVLGWIWWGNMTHYSYSLGFTNYNWRLIPSVPESPARSMTCLWGWGRLKSGNGTLYPHISPIYATSRGKNADHPQDLDVHYSQRRSWWQWHRFQLGAFSPTPDSTTPMTNQPLVTAHLLHDLPRHPNFCCERGWFRESTKLQYVPNQKYCKIILIISEYLQVVSINSNHVLKRCYIIALSRSLCLVRNLTARWLEQQRW